MEGQLVKILDELRAEFGGPGAQALLSNVGFWLIRKGVHPSELPGSKLSAFFASMPAYCTIDGSRLFFKEGAPEVAEAGHNDEPSLRVRRDLWEAFVDPTPGRSWFIQLSDLRFVHEASDAPRDPLKELGLVRVPTISLATQKEHAREVLGGLAGLDAALDLEPWPSATLEALPADKRSQLRAARTKHVVELATQWLREHRIPTHHFVFHAREISTEAAPGSVLKPGSQAPVGNEKALREALHRAIDRMTYAELASLNVPARLLVR